MSYYPDASFLISANHPRQFFDDIGIEIVFAGRSNAGKSSAINSIVNQRGFARISKSPGRTQLINFFQLRDKQRLVDLPGYGFAKVPKNVQDHWAKLIENYFHNRHSLAGIFIIVDIRRGLSDYDRKMLQWSERLGCSAHVLLSKSDKLKRNKASQAI
ncbi:MAG: ribosome biogenesis GTP-binding protein YihA/YsxC [Pseudomonadota bacterium]|nr:ribosome biogenesis GTP-binding protein YihA/YsxC [Pseudomonadota bacterium]